MEANGRCAASDLRVSARAVCASASAKQLAPLGAVAPSRSAARAMARAVLAAALAAAIYPDGHWDKVVKLGAANFEDEVRFHSRLQHTKSTEALPEASHLSVPE